MLRPFIIERLVEELEPAEIVIVVLTGVFFTIGGLLELRKAFRLRRRSPDQVWRIRHQLVSGLMALLFLPTLSALAVYAEARALLWIILVCAAGGVTEAILRAKAKYEEPPSFTRLSLRRRFGRGP